MSKRNKTNNIKYGGGVTVVKNMKSHANDPFVLESLERAKAFLNKVDLTKLPK